MTEEHTFEIVTLEPRPAALLRETVRMDALTDYFGRAFHTVAETLAQQGVAVAGPPLGVYYGMPSETVEVGAGFPTDRPISPAGGVSPETLPGGRAVQALHVGSYDGLQETYGRLLAWVAEQGLSPGAMMWEAYLTEPDDAHPEAAQTLIVWPVA